METGQEERLVKRKYYAFGLSALLVTAFILVQPMQANSILFPSPFSCQFRPHDGTALQPEDPLSMNTVRNDKIVKTIHVEKHVFDCKRDPGDRPTILDLTIIAEIYENIETRSVLSKKAIAVTCVKTNGTAKVLDCSSSTISKGDVDTTTCIEMLVNHPQEMNTVNRGKIVKTIEAQKEVFLCDLGQPSLFENLTEGAEPNTLLDPLPDTIPVPLGEADSDDRIVDVVLFTEIWENLNLLPTNSTTIVQKKFESFRCVIQITSPTSPRCLFQNILD